MYPEVIRFAFATTNSDRRRFAGSSLESVAEFRPNAGQRRRADERRRRTGKRMNSKSSGTAGVRFLVMSLVFAVLPSIRGLAQDSAPAAPNSDPDPEKVRPGFEGVAGEEAPKVIPAGHSIHGESFNEGPRQAAYLMEGLPRVRFAVTTESAEAQDFIEQGVTQLHGFWYFEAERSFRQAAAIDPDLAMAYWGMANANVENEKRAKGFIEKAKQAMERRAVSDRERLWIEGSATFFLSDKNNKTRRQEYVKSLERIVLAYPDDIEAKAFLVCRLWQFQGDLPIPSHVVVDALLDQVLAAAPMHPAHHYDIHLWDYEKSDEALPAAARCGQSSPAIAHMWHMSGHIFSRLHRYADACWQQEASARVDHAHMIRDRVLPDQIHNYAHNNEWLIRNLIHVGRVDDAIDLAKNMIDLPRHPRWNRLDQGGKSASYGRERLFDVLESFELWSEILSLADTVWLEPTKIEEQQIRRLEALGSAFFELRRSDELGAILSDLESRRAVLDHLRITEAMAAGERAREERARALEEAAKSVVEAPTEPPTEKTGNKTDAKPVERTTEQVVDEAKKRVEREIDGRLGRIRPIIEKLSFFGDVLAAEASPESLRSRIDALPRVGGLRRSRFHLDLGDSERATTLAREEKDRAPGEILPLANLVFVLMSSGKEEDALRELEELRKLASRARLDVPPLARLRPIVERAGWPEDWRGPIEVASDVGDRPALDSLGPFRWSPYEAPEWQLSDASGRTRTLSQYRGRPVIVILYLGFGCLHCVEQLRTFEPRVEELRREGLEIVGIGTDAADPLRAALTSWTVEGKGPFPFPLLSDPSLSVFHAYRAYDDFEKQPLHGTFLIDGEGRVHWQDISYDPFTDVDFLLDEARRLLGRPHRRSTSL
jgi:peroxiredoxin/tetratricopeptide (TPR) repeat protein